MRAEEVFLNVCITIIVRSRARRYLVLHQTMPHRLSQSGSKTQIIKNEGKLEAHSKTLLPCPHTTITLIGTSLSVRATTDTLALLGPLLIPEVLVDDNGDIFELGAVDGSICRRHWGLSM